MALTSLELLDNIRTKAVARLKTLNLSEDSHILLAGRLLRVVDLIDNSSTLGDILDGSFVAETAEQQAYIDALAARMQTVNLDSDSALTLAADISESADETLGDGGAGGSGGDASGTVDADTVAAINKKINNLNSIKANKTDLQAEITRATAKEAELETSIENSGISTNNALNNKVDKTSLESNYYTKLQVDKELSKISASGGSGSGSAVATNAYTKTETDILLAEKLSTADFNTQIASYYTKTDADTKITENNTSLNNALANKVDKTTLSSNYYTKTQVDQEITKKVPTNFYSRTEVDSKLTNKADKSSLTNDYSNNTQLQTKLDLKADKTSLGDYYTKKETSEYIATQIKNIDHYNKTEANQLLSGKVDVVTLQEDYTNNAELKKQMDAKVSTSELETAVANRQKDQAALEAKVLETGNTLSGQITAISTAVQNTSTQFTEKLTALEADYKAGDTANEARLNELITTINSVKTDLVAKDTSLGDEINAINAKIPSAASSTNQLADKAYVKEQVANNAARGISSTASGDSFSSLDALTAGPWYYQGATISTPHANDYAIVTADALNDGNDVRYNYDGAVWIKFQVYQNGAGFTPTSEQTAAMNSGATSTNIAQIATNTANITKEISDRKTAITDLEAKISTGISARLQGDADLDTKISTEATTRINADNDLKILITQEQTDRQTGDNALAVTISSNKTDIETKVGALATLNTDVKTSIVECINDLHNELHDERVAKAGDTMSGQLKIVSTGTADLLHLQGGDKGVTFRMDATAGAMSIVPVSAQSTGFEVSYNSIKPRTTNIDYYLGSNSNYWTHAYITNLNGKSVDSLAEDSDIQNLQTQIDANAQTATGKVAKTGDEMTGTLKIKRVDSGDLIHLEGAGKGITFNIDSSTGFMHLIPVSAPTTGFEFSANAFTPRTTAVSYSIGSNSLPWTNVWATNLNGVPIASYITQSELEQHTQNATSRLDTLEANETATEASLNTLKSNVYTKSEADNLLANKADTSALNSKVSTADIYNLVYPVGSVYLSMDASFNPNNTFGGTWEKIKDGVFLESNATPNTEKEAGLPNIEGYIENYDQTGKTSLLTDYGLNPLGCFGWYAGTYYVVSNAIQATSGARCKNNRITFDASRSSAVYGKSDTVQPASITVIMWKRTA